MASIYLEYIVTPDQTGYESGDLSLETRSGQKLSFFPRQSDGRRIERFQTKEEAEHLLIRFPQLFMYASDIMDEEDVAIIREMIDAAVNPLQIQVNTLTEVIGQLNKLLAADQSRNTSPSARVTKKKIPRTSKKQKA